MIRTGIVEQFDADAGLGTVREGTGARSWLFHLTTISDGTRSIAEGAPVSFVVRAGGPGRWEAFEVTPI